MNNEQLVIVRDGKALADSRTVANIFEKEHKHVLESIRNLADELPEDFREPNFRLSSYEQQIPGGGTKELPMYLLTRDAFTLLAMGFTGPKALKFKLEYIKAFNEMEAALKNGDQTLHKAVEEGKASDHPVFDHVIEGAFSSRRPLTVDDFPCLIQVNGKRYIPFYALMMSLVFPEKNYYCVKAFCLEHFSEDCFCHKKLPRRMVVGYCHFNGYGSGYMGSRYPYRLLSEKCIPELVDFLNEIKAYLNPNRPLLMPKAKCCMYDTPWTEYLRQPREPHPDSLADLPIGEILKLSGFELIKIFLKGLAAK